MPMKKSAFDDNNLPFAHMFYFQLTDTSHEAMNLFIQACIKYLGGHPDQIHFSVGTRALHIRRGVSALDFEVSVHMVLKNIYCFNKLSGIHDDRTNVGRTPLYLGS